MHIPKILFHWSGGKDSSIALNVLLKNDSCKVDMLLTTVNQQLGRVSMHGVRKKLIQQQAESIGIPISFLELPDQPDMAEYNKLMQTAMIRKKNQGYSHAAFGDIFLEDLKSYRESQMEESGFETLFPIWQRDTKELIGRFIDDGFKAIVVCAKSEKLDKSFAGRLIDQSFLDDLPDDVDPCGENGEFHTFVYDGPLFSKPVPFSKGELIYREYNSPDSDKNRDDHSIVKESQKTGFWFCDLLPK